MAIAPQDFTCVLYEVKDHICRITLNRPERRNALNRRAYAELEAALRHADADAEVRCVVVTGTDPAFCSGDDVQEIMVGGASERAAAPPRVKFEPTPAAMAAIECGKPVIAAVNGAAVGVGATMQLAMDFRLASTEARYGFVFARRGLNPEAASSWFLPHLVGPQTALEWCFTGRVFPASEAKEKGLVRSLHAPEELLPAARTLAREIADNTAPVSVAITRQLIWRMAGAAHPMDAHMADSRGIQQRGAQADVREGVNSFLEKRQPNYPDKVSKDLPNIWDHWKQPTCR